MFSEFIHVATRVRISSFKAKCSLVWIHHVLFIHSSVDGLLDCFTLLAIVDNAVLNMGSQVSVCVSASSSLGPANYVSALGLCTKNEGGT